MIDPLEGMRCFIRSHALALPQAVMSRKDRAVLNGTPVCPNAAAWDRFSESPRTSGWVPWGRVPPARPNQRDGRIGRPLSTLPVIWADLRESPQNGRTPGE